MSPDCDFNPPIIQECVPAEIVDVSPPDAVIDWPLLKPPCIPAFSGSVPTTIFPKRESGSDVKIVPDPNSECGYKLAGNIDVCSCPADVYVDGSILKWNNEGGTLTTRNGSPTTLNGEDAGYSPAIQETFQFWSCNSTDGKPDKTQIVYVAPEDFQCVDKSFAFVDRTDIQAPLLKWNNDDGDKTIVRSVMPNLATPSTTTIEILDDTLSDMTGLAYDSTINYQISFWHCLTYVEDEEVDNPPDKIVFIEAEFGTQTTPYQMGKNSQGSSRENAGPPITWGGSTDGPPNIDMSVARTDTWRRDRPPIEYNTGVQTDGVNIPHDRIYIQNGSPASGQYTKTTFRRTVKCDSKGIVYSISGESIVGVEVDSGSGSSATGLE